MINKRKLNDILDFEFYYGGLREKHRTVFLEFRNGVKHKKHVGRSKNNS